MAMVTRTSRQNIEGQGPRPSISSRRSFQRTQTLRSSLLSNGSAAAEVATRLFEQGATYSDDYRRGKQLTVWHVILENFAFQVLTMIALMVALFAPGVWVLADLPDTPYNLVLDCILGVCVLIFVIDIVLKALADRTAYLFSALFLLDLVGTMSMLLDISILVTSLSSGDGIDQSGTNLALARTARLAKLGSRAGRLLKILRVLSAMRVTRHSVWVREHTLVEAKVLGSSMGTAVSMRVALVCIALVIVTPVFSFPLYPVSDLSMQTWTAVLESKYVHAETSLLASSATSTDIFERGVEELVSFYRDLNYKPYNIDGWCENVTIGGKLVTIHGQRALDNPVPARRLNILKVRSSGNSGRHGCKDSVGIISFDFTGSNQLEALIDCCMILYVVMAICFASFSMTQIVQALLVRPLSEVLLNAALIVEHFHLQIDGVFMSELGVISCVLEKFVRLNSVMGKQHSIKSDDAVPVLALNSDPVPFGELSAESQAVFTEIMNFELSEKNVVRPSVAEKEANMLPVVSTRTDLNHVESWNLDVINEDEESLRQLALYIFFDSELGGVAGNAWTDADTFSEFYSMVKSNYGNMPYHCHMHAIDVLHFTWRLQCLTQTSQWLSPIEQHALLVAAMGHDMGHFGKTNQFLAETQHELALRYNDKSPLENMHCCILFTILQSKTADVFYKGGKDDFTTARKVCVEAILHTDNAHHFSTVQDIVKIYEMSESFCEDQGTLEELDIFFIEEVLQKDRTFWIQCFLHLADISNPLRPFDICFAWAMRVLGEFFEQGDEEKELGIPVGMLNDRSKVSKPGSQHGFINFLVAPFVVSICKVFPPLLPLASSMACNLSNWHRLWVKEEKPSEEDKSKRANDITKLKTTVKEISDNKVVQWKSLPKKYVNLELPSREPHAISTTGTDAKTMWISL
eukprot:TRINITY_DN14902_c0_g2_i1.p1 TRINITY_DN14902_c0_g2~~TRINITY_DN14902_c0_g2_i1.p1  ORF type:complete len:918 (+),score=130.56 TRINITY_DN14902_c0_g2_i1:47-2800(+)